MPNGGYLLKRLLYLKHGTTPGFTVKQLFSQLDPNDNMVVGLHWKEYSVSQTIEMVSPLGFELISAKTIKETVSANLSIKGKLIQYLMPGGDTQVVVFRKTADFSGKFYISRDS